MFDMLTSLFPIILFAFMLGSLVYSNALSNTGVCTLTAPATTGVTWNCTSLEVSMTGPTIGPNASLTIYDGAVGGTILYRCYLYGPVYQSGSIAGGSVGSVQKINLPTDAQGHTGIQSITGAAMNIQVTGTGANQVSINARFTDGLP